MTVILISRHRKADINYLRVQAKQTRYVPMVMEMFRVLTHRTLLPSMLRYLATASLLLMLPATVAAGETIVLDTLDGLPPIPTIEPALEASPVPVDAGDAQKSSAVPDTSTPDDQSEPDAPTLQTLDSFESVQRLLSEQAARISSLESLLEDQANDQSTAAAQEIETLTSRIVDLEANAEIVKNLENEFLDSPSEESFRTTTGRLHLDYWTFPGDSDGINLIEGGDPTLDPQDRFELRRIRIGIRGSVPPRNVSYQLDLEFSGIEQIGIRDAWIGIDELFDLDTIRIGNQKRPYGLDQLNSSNFMTFIERPLIIEAINDPNRRLGGQYFGTSDDLRFNYRFGVFNMVPIDEDGVISNDRYQVEFAGRLASTLWYDQLSEGRKYFHIGTAATFAFPSDDPTDTTALFRSRPEARSNNRWIDTGVITGTNSYQLLAIESVLNLGPLQLGGEAVNVWLQRNDTIGRDVHFNGAYVYASYFLTGEHQPWNRQLGILGRVEPYRDLIHPRSFCRHRQDDCVRGDSGWGAWQIAARLSYADLNDDDLLGGYGRSTTFALNWYWNSHTRLQVNYILGQIDDRETPFGAGTAVVSGNYQIVGSRLLIDY